MNDEQLLRYSRQIMLPQIDVAGQERLLAAHVLIVGLGGLGSPAALYLAAAGVGRLSLADDDQVDLSNLQRQIVHGHDDVGVAKVRSAARSIGAINPDTTLDLIETRMDGAHLMERVADADLVLDASDNFDTRYQLNDACFGAGVPLVSGAAIRMEGQISVFDPRVEASPCYRCLYPEADDDSALNCSENGVAAPLVGIIGSMQAMEALKVITGIGDALVGKVLYLDASRMEWQSLNLSRRPGCAVHV
ncbi:MAG: molybdopterin-synthase adenylyltransferase MoeB [Gammaproteobacteria bacterium]|nr:MAG: molybdopterin-synthase adenylyltransferase MoeB [Gammaproteobacteria bacterium]